MKKIKFFKKDDEIEVMDPEIVDAEENEEETEMEEKKGVSKRTKLIITAVGGGMLMVAGKVLYDKIFGSKDYCELEEVNPDSEYYDEDAEEIDDSENEEESSDEE